MKNSKFKIKKWKEGYLCLFDYEHRDGIVGRYGAYGKSRFESLKNALKQYKELIIMKI